MEKLIVSYRLKPGVSIGQYATWTAEVDQRVTTGQPAFIRFEVYAVEGTVEGEPYCDVFEDIEVTSFDEWEEAVAGETMSYVGDMLFAHYADESSLRIIRGRRIPPAVPEGVRPPLPAGAPPAS